MKAIISPFVRDEKCTGAYPEFGFVNPAFRVFMPAYLDGPKCRDVEFDRSCSVRDHEARRNGRFYPS
jgi:hypothetical protein